MTYATATSRCAQRVDGYTQVCTTRETTTGCFGTIGMRDEPAWLFHDGTLPSSNCTAQVQVFANGQVTLVLPSTDDSSQQLDSGNVFRVRWASGSYPSAASGAGCPARCSLSMASSCLCDIEVDVTAAFANALAPPSVEQIEEQLHIGSVEPDAFADGTYSECVTAACDTARVAGVTVWLHGGGGGAFNEQTVFEVIRNGTQPTYLANKIASVRIPGTGMSFRNPPKFHSFLRPSVRDAEHETAALIDHLLWHQNTAPFTAQRLTQRLTTSNPSPRYVLAVADAFRTGAYGGRTFSGMHGDLGATFAAILLDREARSLTLEADPTHGGLREPLLKLYQLMRSLEFRTSYGQIGTITPDFGQDFMRSPSVFNFYDPLYAPEGPVQHVGLVAPEAQIATSPYMLSFLNDAGALIQSGKWDGSLTYANATANASAIVDELDLLLTGGRLTAANRDVIIARYERTLATLGDPQAALRDAQELFLFSGEFHTTSNLNVQRDVPRFVPRPMPTAGRPYKALVYLYLAGGADTFNVLVPHSQCGTKDLHAEYAQVRGANAMPKSRLLPISAGSSNQPCLTFGVHHKLSSVQQAFADGDAAFVANMGNLVQPLTKAGYDSGDPRPPSLYSHNTQTNVAQNVHAQAVTTAKGVLGRIGTKLTTTSPSGRPPFKLSSYSTAGNVKILEGGSSAPEILPLSGTVRLTRLGQLETDVAALTNPESASIFAETFSNLVEKSISGAEEMAVLLSSSEAQLTTTFPSGRANQGSTIGEQLAQVARVLRARAGGNLDTERDMFHVQENGWDSHATIDVATSPGGLALATKWEYVNDALTAFTTELKAMGLWDNVTILMGSEFGRTMDTNGQGTDHGEPGLLPS